MKEALPRPVINLDEVSGSSYEQGDCDESQEL